MKVNGKIQMNISWLIKLKKITVLSVFCGIFASFQAALLLRFSAFRRECHKLASARCGAAAGLLERRLRLLAGARDG